MSVRLVSTAFWMLLLLAPPLLVKSNHVAPLRMAVVTWQKMPGAIGFIALARVGSWCTLLSKTK